MIEKFVTLRRTVLNEFLDLNHTSKAMILVWFRFRSASDARRKVMAGFGITTLGGSHAA